MSNPSSDANLASSTPIIIAAPETNPPQETTFKSGLPDYEKIGLLYGLANKKDEKNQNKQDIVDVVDKALEKTAIRYSLAVEQYETALANAGAIKRELEEIVEKLQKTRTDVLKNLKDAILYLLPADFTVEHKQQIIDKVLRANIDTLSTLEADARKIMERLSTHVDLLNNNDPAQELAQIFQIECDQIRTYHDHLQKIEKGFGAGQSIHLNTAEPPKK